jgi:hypothetical protein
MSWRIASFLRQDLQGMPSDDKDKGATASACPVEGRSSINLRVSLQIWTTTAVFQRPHRREIFRIASFHGNAFPNVQR